MNKILSLGLLAFLASEACNAQSSVTLYGRIDNGLIYRTGAASGTYFGTTAGFFAGTIVGLKGTEDLGQGFSTIFDLRLGANAQRGTLIGGALFDKTATVGVSSDRYGSFKLGNMGVGEIQEASFVVDPQLFQTFGISNLVRGRNWSQAGNGLEYSSPSFRGLSFRGQYDLANSPFWNAGIPGSAPTQLGTTSGLGSAQGRSDGIAVKYQLPSALIVAIYDEIRDPNGGFSNVYLTSRSTLLGGTYTIGPVKALLGYQHLAAPSASSAGYFGTTNPTNLPAGTSPPTTVDHEWIGVNWQVTPADSLTAAIYHANANKGNGHATMYTLGEQHYLSKKTFLYAEAGYILNSATSNIGLGDGFSDPYGANANFDAVNGGTRTSPNYGRPQFGLAIGLLTMF